MRAMRGGGLEVTGALALALLGGCGRIAFDSDSTDGAIVALAPYFGPERPVANDQVAPKQVPSLVWDGAQFALTWFDERDYSTTERDTYFVQVGHEGPFGTDTVVAAQGAHAYHSSLVWTGTDYAVIWATTGITGNRNLWLARMSLSGTKTLAEVRVTDYFNGVGGAHEPSMTWAQGGFAVAWEERPIAGDNKIQFARLSAAGGRQTTPLTVITTATDLQSPAVVWTGAEYGIAWAEAIGATKSIWFARVDAAGTTVLSSQNVVPDVGNIGGGPALVWTGTEYGLAAGPMFLRLSAAATPIGTATRLNTGLTAEDSLVWTGAEYAVVWRASGLFLARISAEGVVVDAPPIQLAPNAIDPTWPSLVFTGRDYGVAWQDDRHGHPEIYFMTFLPP